MVSMMALIREGHLNIIFKMCFFLKSEHNGVTVFDPTEPEIDLNQFPTEDWSATPYGLYKEDVPLNAPPQRDRFHDERLSILIMLETLQLVGLELALLFS